MHLQVYRDGLPAIEYAMQVAAKVRAVDGMVLVLYAGFPEKMGSVFIPENADIRADLGIVVASGDLDYKVGELVVFDPNDGTTVKDAFLGEDRCQYRVKSFGVYTPNPGFPIRVAPDKSIVAKIVDMEHALVSPYGDNFVIEKDPLAESDGGILLPDNALMSTGMATVIAVGPRQHNVAVGDRVCYSPRALRETGFEFEVSGKEYENLAICNELAVLYVLVPGNA